MTGRLAVDFGTSNTVLAVWDDIDKEGKPFHLSEYGQIQNQRNNERISIIPSLIHYPADDTSWIGRQVLQRNLYHSANTFRWMKHYILNRNPVTRKINGHSISYSTAGRDFLSGILLSAMDQLNLRDEDVGFSVPVESFEHYENWLGDVAESIGIRRLRIIDEPLAAAIGYGSQIDTGDSYLIFDFGGGTLDVAIVVIEDSIKDAQKHKRCRVVGKAGEDIGGMKIDQWIFEDVLKKNDLDNDDEDIRQLGNALLVECEKAKERLSFFDRADITVVNPDTGSAIELNLTQKAFEDILEEHNAFTQINRTLGRALNASRERGYKEDDIKYVLMIGGSSYIPSVQQVLKRFFGKDKVMMDRPLDAIARGAAAFVAGFDYSNYIQHDYAIRYLNRKRGEYDHEIIIKQGTTYPTEQGVARIKVVATYDGQTHLGLSVFELAQDRRIEKQPLEIVFDSSGTPKIVSLAEKDQVNRSSYWMNQDTPTFLVADPPAKEGFARFEIEFSIDNNKRLLLTAKDILTGRTTHLNYPVVKLD